MLVKLMQSANQPITGKKHSEKEYQHYDMTDTDNTLTAVTEYSYWLWLFNFISAL